MNADAFNALLEAAGAVFLWRSVYEALRARCIVGVHWTPFAFFGAWALWNIFYYGALDQHLSRLAAVGPLSANVAMLVLFWRYRRRRVRP